jgi:hypothetical protein
MRGRGLLLGRLLAVGVTLVAHAAGMPRPVEAQTANEIGALKAQLDRRFEVLPLQDGVLLRPRATTAGVRSVEIHQGAIAIDGQVVTGAELRTRLGGDADLVVRVSYLGEADQRTLAGAPAAATQPSGPPSSGVPEAVAPAVPPAPSVGADDRTNGRNGRSRGWGGPWGRRGGDRGGDRVRFGGRVTVGENETVDGDVVVIAGRAQVLGRVTGDVVVVGGSAELGPRADVGADVVVVGGQLMRDPSAHVGGEVHEVGVGPLAIDPRVRMPHLGFWDWSWSNPLGSAFSLMSTVVRLAILCLLCALVVLVGGAYVDRVGALAADQPMKSGLVGFLSQVFVLPLTVVTIVVLVITIVGIPFLLLLPFVALALCVVALVGFTGVAQRLGGMALARVGGPSGAYTATVLGVLLILGPVLLGRLMSFGGAPLWFVATPLSAIGFLAEYAAWTIGFGAAVFLAFGSSPRAVPPPLP